MREWAKEGVAIDAEEFSGPKNPVFTNVVVVEGNVKTVHIGGQDALNASGEIIGKGDIVAQIEQI